MIALDNAPTPERARRSHFTEGPAIASEHEAARAGARLHRAVAPLERLHRDGSINDRQHDAGLKLRDDFEIGVVGARNGLGSGGAIGYGYAQYRLECLRAYQDAIKVIGSHIAAVVAPICCGVPGGGDITLAQYSRETGMNRQEVAGIFKLGLTQLADHYGFA